MCKMPTRIVLGIIILSGSVYANTPSPNLGQLVFEYATKGDKLQWELDRFGEKTVYKYDQLGQLVETEVDGKTAREYNYQKDHEQATITRDALGRIVKDEYDNHGRLVKQTNALGLVSEFKYDKYGRMISRTGAGAYPLRYQYNSFGKITSYTNQNGATTKFEYDTLGHLIKRIWPDGLEVKYSYNKDGKLAAKEEAGRVTGYMYDQRGNLAQVQILQNGASLCTTMNYDDNHQLISTTENGITVKFSYDRFGHKLLEESPVGIIKYLYNERGLLNVRQCRFKDSNEKFITQYGYDGFDRVIEVKSPAGTFKYEWGKNNKIAAIIFGNNQKIVYNYDQVGRLITKKLGDAVLVSYSYDALDRRVTASYLGVNWKYNYDQYSQLIYAESALGAKEEYQYDSIGNRIASNQETLTYNKLNQIDSNGYGYDKWGNLIQTPSAKYKYDVKNRLIEVEKLGKIIKYEYDPLNQRIGSVENRKRTEYLMSDMVEYARKIDDSAQYHTLGLDLIGSLDKTGAVGSVLASSNVSGDGFNYLYDGNGNVIASCNSNGTITERLAYNPFGKQISGKQLPFTFSTKAIDGTGLNYYGNRFYDPSIARWERLDPTNEHSEFKSLQDKQTVVVDENMTYSIDIPIRNLNLLYAFVNNSPINNIDIRGLCSCPALNANATTLPNAPADSSIWSFTYTVTGACVPTCWEAFWGTCHGTCSQTRVYYYDKSKGGWWSSTLCSVENHCS